MSMQSLADALAERRQAADRVKNDQKSIEQKKRDMERAEMPARVMAALHAFGGEKLLEWLRWEGGQPTANESLIVRGVLAVPVDDDELELRVWLEALKANRYGEQGDDVLRVAVGCQLAKVNYDEVFGRSQNRNLSVSDWIVEAALAVQNNWRAEQQRLAVERELFAKRVKLLESLINVAYAWLGLEQERTKEQQAWVNAWAAKVWEPWTLWELTVATVGSLLWGEKQDDDCMVRCLESPDELLKAFREGRPAYVEEVLPAGNTRLVAVGAMLKAVKVEFEEHDATISMPYHKSRRVGENLYLNVPPFGCDPFELPAPPEAVVDWNDFMRAELGEQLKEMEADALLRSAIRYPPGELACLEAVAWLEAVARLDEFDG